LWDNLLQLGRILETSVVVLVVQRLNFEIANVAYFWLCIDLAFVPTFISGCNGTNLDDKVLIIYRMDHRKCLNVDFGSVHCRAVVH
jgi:hypothetical protein